MSNAPYQVMQELETGVVHAKRSPHGRIVRLYRIADEKQGVPETLLATFTSEERFIGILGQSISVYALAKDVAEFNQLMRKRREWQERLRSGGFK
jgi:hypothetical protein